MDGKTWMVVGTSIKRGEKKLRLANGTAAARQRVLEKDGHTEVRLWDLPNAMTAEDAAVWLAAQGDTVPVQAAKPDKPAKPVQQERRVERAVRQLMAAAEGEIAHEALGREAYKVGKLGFLAWEDISLETRQEFSRNAAIRAGIKCPPGTYPELEDFLRKDGVKILADGTLV